MRSPHTLLLAVGFVLAAAACDFGPVRTVAPDQEGVERIALEATTALESGDSAIADSLSWPAGRVARGTVTIRREKENILLLEQAQNAALTDSGTAHFSDLLGGRYWAWGEHRLSDEEVTRLPDDRQATVRVLGGGDFTTVRRGPGSTPLRLPMQANEADGLVISEKSFFVANERYDYRFFGYVEIYNNGTETVYLDGMLIGRAYGTRSVSGDIWTCAEKMNFVSDPAGIWSRVYEQFPGSGSDHPLNPGEMALVATDAIDHSQVVNGYLDLSKVADFEFHGPADIDNPDVPNMQNPRPGSCLQCAGHGLVTYGDRALFLTDPVETDELPSQRIVPGSDRVYQRFPSGRIVDVMSNENMAPNVDGKDWCPDAVHPSFDRVTYFEHGNRDDLHLFSLHRPVVGRRPNGQPILLDTNTSAVDLELMSRTPGELPPRQ